jgi:hypothetical protein
LLIQSKAVIRLFALMAVRSLLLRFNRVSIDRSTEPSVGRLRVTRDEAKQRRGVGVSPDRPDHSPVRVVGVVTPSSALPQTVVFKTPEVDNESTKNLRI